MAHHLRGLPLLVVLTLTTVTMALPDDAQAAQAGVLPTANSPSGDTAEELSLLQMGAARSLLNPRDKGEDEPSDGGGGSGDLENKGNSEAAKRRFEGEKGRSLKSKVKKIKTKVKKIKTTVTDLENRVTKVEEIQADAGSSPEDEGGPEPEDEGEPEDQESFEEKDRTCNVDAELCTPELLPDCEMDMKTLQCVPKGTAQPLTGEARNCSGAPGSAECKKQEGCEVAPNLMCVPKGTAGGSLLEKRKATSGSYHMTTLKNHPRCTALYPDLEVHAGNHGDVCRTRHHEAWGHFCPTGCTTIPYPAPAPHCLLAGTRETCHHHYTCTARSLHHHIANHDAYPDLGNYCHGAGNHNWIAPDGCHASWHPPYAVMPHTSRPCRVREGTPKAPTAYWELIASGTHGVTASMEVGVTSSNSQSVTKEETHSFGVEVTTGTSFGVPGFGSVDVEVTASYEFSSMIGKTVESVLEQSQVRTVEVECPDWFHSPTETRHPANARIEYIWQFVVSDGNMLAKTDYFRCHQTHGDPLMPECPPQLCGDTSSNEYCKLSLSSVCQRYLRYGR